MWRRVFQLTLRHVFDDEQLVIRFLLRLDDEFVDIGVCHVFCIGLGAFLCGVAFRKTFWTWRRGEHGD